MTLEEFFRQVPRAALAFSGGTDSALLLWAAKQYGCDVRAYYVRTAFQPQFEYDDAQRLAAQLGASMQVLELRVLSVSSVRENPKDRCYYCKKNGV